MTRRASVLLDNDFAVIRIPIEEVHGLRVALAPCGCVATKSMATMRRREGLDRALGKAESLHAQKRRGKK